MRFRWFVALLIVYMVLPACAVKIPPKASSTLAQEPIETLSPTPLLPSPTFTLIPTQTPTPIPDTATPTSSPTSTSTLPATTTPTSSPTSTATLFATATLTSSSISTATLSGTATPTNSLTPTATLPATQTPTTTPTSTPEVTPTATYPPPPEEVHVPILMYHYISELPEDADRYRIDLTVPPTRFEEQLQYLKEQDYQTIKLMDIYDNLSIGKPLPENPIVLTFDDGYKDAYSNVLPMLQAYEYSAEFFILATPAHFEAPHYLSWNDVRIMAESGMSMQAHGRDHYDLTNRSYDFLVYQILGAKEAVQAHSGEDVTFFCYPSGRYDDDTQAVVASAGYFGALTTEWGATQRLDNRYTWSRIRIKGAWSLDKFISILTALSDE